jgi:hypothetical protein
MDMFGGVELALANGIGVVSVVFGVGMLVIRGYLIPGKWHRESMQDAHDQVARAEERADRWEAVALRALDATERLTEPTAVAAKVLSQLPNPAADQGAEA